jgi:hypothetical protein
MMQSGIEDGSIQPKFWLCAVNADTLVAVNDGFYLVPVHPDESAKDVFDTWLRHEKIIKKLKSHIHYAFTLSKPVFDSDFVILLEQLDEESDIGRRLEMEIDLRHNKKKAKEMKPLLESTLVTVSGVLASAVNLLRGEEIKQKHPDLNSCLRSMNPPRLLKMIENYGISTTPSQLMEVRLYEANEEIKKKRKQSRKVRSNGRKK